MNPNFAFLTDITYALGRNKDNPKEVARLLECQADVRSRLTEAQLAEYEQSLVPTESEQQRREKIRAQELKEMDLQRDSNSI